MLARVMHAHTNQRMPPDLSDQAECDTSLCTLPQGINVNRTDDSRLPSTSYASTGRRELGADNLQHARDLTPPGKLDTAAIQPRRVALLARPAVPPDRTTGDETPFPTIRGHVRLLDDARPPSGGVSSWPLEAGSTEPVWPSREQTEPVGKYGVYFRGPARMLTPQERISHRLPCPLSPSSREITL